MAKLLQYFENYLADCETDVGTSNCDASKWIALVRKTYAPHTLKRMLTSQQVGVRQAAAWALSHLGDESHSCPLGMLLRDSARMVRTCADEARRAIAQRTQSPWHRQTVSRVEQLLAEGMFKSASELASHLVDETDSRSDVYMLRAWVRLQSSAACSISPSLNRTQARSMYTSDRESASSTKWLASSEADLNMPSANNCSTLETV